MSQITLYQFPGACSRVTLSALEEIGLPYTDQVVNLRTELQKSPEYLRINPKAKVPAISFDGRIMTENAAILAFLNWQHPAARLLPASEDALEAAQGLVDLIWCSGTIHPIVRQIRMPAKWTKGDPSGVRADGIEKFAKECEGFAARLSDDRWWYGASWSIIDVYIYWAYSTAAKGGFPIANYPALIAHATRVRARPSFQRALARELAAVEREGIDVRPEEL